jgi:hypothetical protein
MNAANGHVPEHAEIAEITVCSTCPDHGADDKNISISSHSRGSGGQSIGTTKQDQRSAPPEAPGRHHKPRIRAELGISSPYLACRHAPTAR